MVMYPYIWIRLMLQNFAIKTVITHQHKENAITVAQYEYSNIVVAFWFQKMNAPWQHPHHKLAFEIFLPAFSTLSIHFLHSCLACRIFALLCSIWLVTRTMSIFLDSFGLVEELSTNLQSSVILSMATSHFSKAVSRVGPSFRIALHIAAYCNRNG